MHAAAQGSTGTEVTVSQPKAQLWAGRVISGIVVVFLVFDGVTKVGKESHVLAAAAGQGYSQSLIVWIRALLLVCTLIYAIPRSSVLGAILLTGYLGGAVESNVRIHHPVFECIFPVIFGALVWAGLFLRDVGLRKMIPLRQDQLP